MSCDTPVDDYCDAWQDNSLKIPENIHHSTDQFFIVFKVETTYAVMSESDDEGDHADIPLDDRYVTIESTKPLTFWAPCPRLEHDNLSRETISDMLSEAGVPLHKQDFMVDRISDQADRIANSVDNKGVRVLPVIIAVSTVACSCYY